MVAEVEEVMVLRLDPLQLLYQEQQEDLVVVADQDIVKEQVTLLQLLHLKEIMVEKEEVL